MKELGQIQPQAIEMEEAVLGAVLLEKNSIYMAAKLLNPESFYRDAHKIIFKTILDMFANSEPIDLLTVTDKHRQSSTLDAVGGPYYLTELTTKVNQAAHLEYHCTVIKEAWIKRTIIAKFSQLYSTAYDPGKDALQILDEAATEVNRIIEQIHKNTLQDLRKVGYDVIEKATHNASTHELVGVPSGFSLVDRFTSGWKAPDLIIIAARPSMGKTALVLQAALNAATQFQKHVAFFSLEMSVEQCVQRLLSMVTGVELSKIIKGQVTLHEKSVLENLGDKVINSHINIDDTPALTIIELRAKCHLQRNTSGLDLIIVDYLQLMEAEGKSREQEISKISRGLKAVAKEFNVPVIALSQLSRAVEARGGDKKPQLADLRESGAIEQDADMVGFLYRPEYYKLENVTLDGSQVHTANLALLIWEKNRNGPLDTLPLKFIGKFTKFTDWDIVSPATSQEQMLLDHTIPVKDQHQDSPF